MKAVMINDTSTKAHLGCKVVIAQILNLAKASGIEFTASCSVHRDWRLEPELQDRMRAADIVIVNGEGTLHDDSNPAQSLAAVASFCKAANVRSALINSVFQRNSPQIIQNCKDFDRVFLRESFSAQYALQSGLKAEVVPDLTLSSDVMEPHRQLHRDNTYIVTDNANREVDRRTLELGLKRNDVQFINFNISEQQNPFVSSDLLPKVVFMADGKRTIPSPSKLPSGLYSRAWRKSLLKPHFRRRVRMMVDLRVYRTAADILGAIASAGGVVAGRYHAACMSLLAQTPFSALESNTWKSQAMLTDAGLFRMFSEKPSESFEKARSWGEDDFQLAKQYVSRARREAAAMFTEIAKIS
jgi:polysaccharide pyruvyl transferase WcaK-like protein